MTLFLGSVLVNQCNVDSVVDTQYEEIRDFHNHMWENFELHNEMNMEQYIRRMRNPSYNVFITVKDEAAKYMPEGVKQELGEMGLTALWNHDAYRKSYYAVLDKGQVICEVMSDRKVETSGSVCDGFAIYQLMSAGYECGDDCSIEIDRKEYARRKRGYNIVVYDNRLKYVIDTVCFDTHEKTCKPIR